MKAIIIVDHGSRRAEANEMMTCVANLVQSMAGPGVIVRAAHMELAEPSISAAFTSCVDAGATDVVVFPYMLSPGKHSTGDIPRLVSEAAANHPAVTFTVTPAFGVNEKLGEIILARAGVDVSPAFVELDPNRCWDPECSERRCGDACRAKQSNTSEVTTAAQRG
jgi:sirohydrochlorin ferrochelatase